MVNLMYRNFCITLLFVLGLTVSFSSPAGAQRFHQWGPDDPIGYAAVGGFNPAAYYGRGQSPQFALNDRGRGYGGRTYVAQRNYGYGGYGQANAGGYGSGVAPGYVRPPGENTGYNWLYSTRSGARGRIDHPVNWGNYERVAGRRNYETGHYAYDYGGGYQTATVDTYPQILWNYLTSSETHYKNWSAYPDRETAEQSGSGPHGSQIKTYGNRNVMRNVAAPADQSLIVLESYAQDGEHLEAIDVMFRVAGYYPEHNDWYWVQYDKNGKVSRLPSADDNARMSGRVQSCIQCHAQAAGGDYVHSND